ncbi:MAG: succinyl-diaminopimelate desuccinylase [Cryobacterium sp.]|nr:succinyl-diaminopimelate desuccinylase [Cryobacterium sp.]
MPRLDLSASARDLTQTLCDVESVSGNEAALADAIEHALADAAHLEVARIGNTVIARTNLGRESRVVIAGHIDTVPVNENLPTRVVDGWLWGRGTVDMKAGVAVQLALAAQVAEPVVDVTWIWYDNEEVDAELNGLRLVAEARPELLVGDFAILGEPTSGEVEGGCNGTLRASVRLRGVRAHSARSWVGVNAIHAAAPVLATLADYVPADVEVDGLVYREGLNAVAISGGVAGNVVPDECVVTVNYRFAPSTDAAAALAHVEQVFDGHEVTLLDVAEGARPGLDHPAVQRFLRDVDATAKPKYGWTDVARFSGLGIPAVNYGPGDPLLAHADDERVELAEVDAVERRLRAWLTGSGRGSSGAALGRA